MKPRKKKLPNEKLLKALRRLLREAREDECERVRARCEEFDDALEAAGFDLRDWVCK